MKQLINKVKAFADRSFLIIFRKINIPVDLAQEYEREYFSDSLPYIRFSYFISLFLYCFVFGILDIWLVAKSKHLILYNRIIMGFILKCILGQLFRQQVKVEICKLNILYIVGWFNPPFESLSRMMGTGTKCSS